MTLNKPIITAILILATIALGVFIIWPDYQEFHRLSQKLDFEKKQLAELEAYFEDLEKTNEQLKEYEDRLVQLDAVLPGRLSVPELFTYLQEVSSQNGLLVEGFGDPSQSESKVLPDIKEASFALSFKGQYSAFKNLLSALWRNAKLIEVDQISFSVPEEGNIFDFKVTLRTHSY